MSEENLSHWEESYISDHFELWIGGTPSRSNETYWDKEKQTDNKWVSIKDINHRYISETEERISDLGVTKSNVKLIPKETVIMSFKLTIGRLTITKCPLYTNEAIVSFIPKTPNSVDTDYLYYGLQSWNLLSEVDQAVKGATLNKDKMSRIFGLFPPLPEQKKIASILNSVDEVIETTQKQIDKLQDLKKATMNELLTKGIGHTEFKDSELGRIPKSWEIYRVSELLVQSKTKGKSNLPIYSVLIDGGMVNRNTQDRRIPSELDDASNLYVKKGNLAYNMMRMWQGASGIAPEDCLVSPAYVVCEPNKDIISQFLGFLLKSEDSIQKLCANSQGITSDRLRLYFEHFAQIKFAIPTIEEQEKIAEVISVVEMNLLKKTQILSQTQSLKKSLMQDLLTGKVRVQVN